MSLSTETETPSTTTTTTNSKSQIHSILGSDSALRTHNPIRSFVEKLNLDPKGMINLSLGDPTVNFDLGAPPKAVIDQLHKNVDSFSFNGYSNSAGTIAARKAISQFVSPSIDPKNVFLGSGCSHSLLFAIEALCNPGSTLLLPKPGFPLYSTIARYLGVSVQFYNLLPDSQWDIDLVQLETLIDPSTTSAILINNPSNPCGSVFSKDHLKTLLKLAESFNIPIISDEVYADMHFPSSPKKFVPLASCEPKVPILTCGGIAKRFSVPGWRLGWLLAYDYQDQFATGGVLSGLSKLCTLLVGPNALVQSIVPTALDKEKVPVSSLIKVMTKYDENANLVLSAFKGSSLVTPIAPSGAMYIMMKIDIKSLGISSDVDFAKALLYEKKLFLLPGSLFGTDPEDGYVRIVLCRNSEILQNAMTILSDFLVEKMASQ